MPELSGISHIDLTITNLERSLAFYTQILGFELLTREERADRALALMVHRGLANGVCLNAHRGGHESPFDEHRAGLDHLSFLVPSRIELEEWERHLADRGVPYTPIAETEFGPVLVLRDPDNIQLELMARSGR